MDAFRYIIAAGNVVFPHQNWVETSHPADADTNKMIDTPDGEIIDTDTAHGVNIDRLRKVNE